MEGRSRRDRKSRYRSGIGEVYDENDITWEAGLLLSQDRDDGKCFTLSHTGKDVVVTERIK